MQRAVDVSRTNALMCGLGRGLLGCVRPIKALLCGLVSVLQWLVAIPRPCSGA